MTEKQLTTLIRKYLSGKATEAEKKIVEQWYESFDASYTSFLEGDVEKINESTVRSLKAIKERIAQQHKKEVHPVMSAKKYVLRWQVAAAVVTLFLITGAAYYFTANKHKGQDLIAVQPIEKDFNPGGNKATLILSNGKKIVLDSSNSGVLSLQGNMKVVKLNNGVLAYHADQRSKIKDQRSKIHYNTITTPRGGQYEIILPDGSKVWLNAVSSIRFPTVFTGESRRVRMTGEAYFEIAKNMNKPFKVSVRGMTVEVLGTHFNIMAYKSVAVMRTTLLEGSIKVAVGSQQSAVMMPGEQALINKKNQIKLIKNVDLNGAIAWKKNLFWFENDNVQTVMKRLSRWYDVDIAIKGNIPDLFTGSMPRNLAFSKAFEVLQKTGSIHYEIHNRKVIVSP